MDKMWWGKETPAEGKGLCSGLHRRFGIELLCSRKPKNDEITPFWEEAESLLNFCDHVDSFPSVFSEHRFAKHLKVWPRLLNPVFNYFYWCFCDYLLAGKDQRLPFHHISSLGRGCVGPLCHSCDTISFKPSAADSRVFLNLEAPAASGQPANILGMSLVVSMPARSCWALTGIWILPGTPDKAVLLSCVTVTVEQPSFLKAYILWVQVAGLPVNSQPLDLFSLLFSFFDQSSWLSGFTVLRVRDIYSPRASKSNNYSRGIKQRWLLLILSPGVPGMQKYFSGLSLFFSASCPGSLSQMAHKNNVYAFSK